LSRLYTFRNNKEVETVVRGGLRMKQFEFHRADVSELVLRWDKCINVLGDGADKYGYCSGANEQHLTLFMTDHLLIQSTVRIQYGSYIIIIIWITLPPSTLPHPASCTMSTGPYPGIKAAGA
jgi:hypothetical protein